MDRKPLWEEAGSYEKPQRKAECSRIAGGRTGSKKTVLRLPLQGHQ